MTDVRLTTAGTSGAWRAQLRDGRTVLADCGHRHRNRRMGADNASWCGRLLVMAAAGNEYFTAERYTDAAVRAAATARRLGARITDEEARAKAQDLLAAWRDAVLAADFHLPA